MRYCSNCGHENQSFSNGCVVKFCAKCGYDMSSLASFVQPSGTEKETKTIIQRSRPLSMRESIRNRDNESENFHSDSRESEISLRRINSISKLDVEIEKPNRQKVTLGDVMNEEKSGFSRPHGKPKSSSKEILSNLLSECKTEKGNIKEISQE